MFRSWFIIRELSNTAALSPLSVRRRRSPCPAPGRRPECPGLLRILPIFRYFVVIIAERGRRRLIGACDPVPDRAGRVLLLLTWDLWHAAHVS
jgi:hypothetical protein